MKRLKIFCATENDMLDGAKMILISVCGLLERRERVKFFWVVIQEKYKKH